MLSQHPQNQLGTTPHGERGVGPAFPMPLLLHTASPPHSLLFAWAKEGVLSPNCSLRVEAMSYLPHMQPQLVIYHMKTMVMSGALPAHTGLGAPWALAPQILTPCARAGWAPP